MKENDAMYIVRNSSIQQYFSAIKRTHVLFRMKINWDCAQLDWKKIWNSVKKKFSRFF